MTKTTCNCRFNRAIRNYIPRIMRKMDLLFTMISMPFTVIFAIVYSSETYAAQHPTPLSSKTENNIDSLRQIVRNSANSERMLQWADSLIRSKRKTTIKDSLKHKKYMQRLTKADKKLSLANRLLTAHYFNKNIDTSYIKRPSEAWTIKFRGNYSFTLTGMRGENNGNSFSGFWASRFRATISAAIVYRGIGISAAINPAKLVGLNKDMEYQLTSYGNRMGFDVIYEAAKTDKGSITHADHKYKMPKGTLNRQGLAANFYYAFNGRRFSFPAAFTQSYIQHKSAGSWLIGASAQWRYTKIKPQDGRPFNKATLKSLNFAIGGGYGHNFCISRRWMLHLSSLPTIVAYDHGDISGDATTTKSKIHFPNFFIANRGAILYTWKHNFAGASATLDFSNIGNSSQLELYNMKWRARIFYGFRL